MGEGLLRFFQEKVKKRWKIAFLTTFWIGLFTHAYKFFNLLPNHDSLHNFYSSQNMVGSGRWFLSIACGISSYFDLPWVIGLLSVLFIALTAVVVAEMFEIDNPVVLCLTGGLLAVSPCVTETIFYEYTADGYFLAMLFAALAAYLSRLGEKRFWRLGVSALLICLSCAIYQAYVSFALVLALLYLVLEIFEGERTLRECWAYAGKQAAIFAAGLAAYYAIWKICLLTSGRAATSYKGIDSLGKGGISLLWKGMVRTLDAIAHFFVEWNVLEFGLTFYGVLSLLFLLATAGILIVAAKKSGVLRRPGQALLALLCLIACVPGSCMWCFVSDSVKYRPMMLQCLMLLYVFTMVLFERYARLRWKNLFGILLTVIVLNNALIANIGYWYLQRCYERSYATAIEMMSRVHELESEYDVEKIAFVGDAHIEAKHANGKEIYRIYLLSANLEANLLHNDERAYPFIQNVLGTDLKRVGGSELNMLKNSIAIREMPAWPHKDSVCVIGKTVVVKLSLHLHLE